MYKIYSFHHYTRIHGNDPGILVASMFMIVIIPKCSDTENINTFWVTELCITSSTCTVNCFNGSVILLTESQNKIKHDTNNVMLTSW